jgi:hypothetical protein
LQTIEVAHVVPPAERKIDYSSEAEEGSGDGPVLIPRKKPLTAKVAKDSRRSRRKAKSKLRLNPEIAAGFGGGADLRFREESGKFSKGARFCVRARCGRRVS